MYEKSEKGMIQQEELRNYAFDDARLDGVSDQFQHFNNRLKHLAQVVNQNDVEETVNSFRLWADRYEQKIEQMGRNILDPELERRRLENNMQIHLNNVENQLSDKIRQKTERNVRMAETVWGIVADAPRRTGKKERCLAGWPSPDFACRRIDSEQPLLC